MSVMKDYRRRDFLRFLGISGAGLAGAGALAACGGGETAAGGGATTLSAAASHFDVIVHYAPIHAGMERGFFDEVIPEVTSFSGGSDTVRAVTSNSRDWFSGSVLGPVLANFAGEPIILTSSWFNATDISFQTRPDSPIRSAADLGGRTVAITSTGGSVEYLIKKAIEDAGLGPDEVRIVALGGAPQQLTALENGVVDVISGTEPTTSDLERQGKARTIFSGQDIVPAWIEVCGGNMRPFFDANRDVMVALHDGLQRCVDLVNDSPEEVARTWSGVIDVEEAVAVAAVQRYAASSAWSLRFDKAALSNQSDSAQFLGIVEQPIDWSTVIDQSALPEPARISL